jgi:hypothetical protein
MVYTMIVLPSIVATYEDMYKKSLEQSLLAIYWSAMNGIGRTFEMRIRSPHLALDDNFLTGLMVPH